MPAKKQISKEMILSAALELLREGGMDAVNVKSLAKKLNCSTQPIYLSFAGMDALRAELTAAAVDVFLRELGFQDGRPDARLYGLAYIRFADEERELFQFLFMRPNAFYEMRAALTPILDSSIAELMEQFQIPYEEAHHFHDQLWMHAHGIASMTATGFCVWDPEKVARMLAECRTYLSRKYEA